MTIDEGRPTREPDSFLRFVVLCGSSGLIFSLEPVSILHCRRFPSLLKITKNHCKFSIKNIKQTLESTIIAIRSIE